MNDIVVYSRAACVYCSLAKRLLKNHGLAFREIDLTAQPDTERELVTRTGRRTLPQIFIDGQLVGGYAELARRIGSFRRTTA